MEHMDWYLGKESDDYVVPNDHDASQTTFTKDIPPQVDNWCQWESVKPQKCETPSTYHGNSQKPTIEEIRLNRSFYSQTDKEPSLLEDEGSSNSSACGPLLINSRGRTSEASSQGQPEFQFQNSLEQINGIFLNSLLEDEFENMENPFGLLQMFSDTRYRSLSFENIWTDMVIDPWSIVKNPTGRESATNTKLRSDPISPSCISEYWGKAEDSSPSCSMQEETCRSDDLLVDTVVATLVPDGPSAHNERGQVDGEDEAKSVEAAVLQELKDVIVQLNTKVRICFRDALFRLAKSSKQHQTVNQSATAGFLDMVSVADINRGSSRSGRPNCLESKTNAIDRMVASLMFTKPYYGPQDLSCLPPSFHQCKDIQVGSGAHRCLDQLSMLARTESANSTKASGNSNHHFNGFASAEPATEVGYILQMSSDKGTCPSDINDQFSMS